MAGRLSAIIFSGAAGSLEGIWKDPPVDSVGSAVLAHPHPVHGGTMHNKVVFRAARALERAGRATLRFNFRGVGASEGKHDGGEGEIEDFRAALAQAAFRGRLPIAAGGFSFGAAVALKAISEDPRVDAYIGIGLPVASESGRDLPRPRVPALFVVGERDSFGPPSLLKEFVGDSGEIVEVPEADHFFEGQLEAVEEAVGRFLATLPSAVPRR